MARSCGPRAVGTALVNLIVASAARAFYDHAHRAKTATRVLRGRHLRSAAWLFCRVTGEEGRSYPERKRSAVLRLTPFFLFGVRGVPGRCR